MNGLMRLEIKIGLGYLVKTIIKINQFYLFVLGGYNNDKMYNEINVNKRYQVCFWIEEMNRDVL